MSSILRLEYLKKEEYFTTSFLKDRRQIEGKEAFGIFTVSMSIAQCTVNLMIKKQTRTVLGPLARPFARSLASIPRFLAYGNEVFVHDMNASISYSFNPKYGALIAICIEKKIEEEKCFLVSNANIFQLPVCYKIERKKNHK